MLKLTDVLNQKADYWELHIFPHGEGGGGWTIWAISFDSLSSSFPPERWESV